jgi:hypothetical protein
LLPGRWRRQDCAGRPDEDLVERHAAGAGDGEGDDLGVDGELLVLDPGTLC